MSLLPPNASPIESALEGASSRLSGVPVPLRTLWDPQTCPAALLPWLAWGVSIDFWDADWTDQAKRTAIAQSISQQRRKGTRASLVAVLERFDPLIGLVEWFEDRQALAPHTFRLELPLAAETSVTYDEALVAALVRDIAAVKPLRSHMIAVHRLRALTEIGLFGASRVVGAARLDMAADQASALNPVWADYLQTEIGEPVRAETGEFLEAA